jgi:putative spermidine/putrescine transport system permease protein
MKEGGEDAGHFAANLRRDQNLEQARLAALSLPALLIVGLVLFVPIGWLAWVSLHNAAGAFSLENYARFSEPIYVGTFLRTLRISFIVTALCVLIGYPLSYFLVQLPARLQGVAMFFVLVPFWTSLLVRTYAWLAILQRKGVVNSLLMDLGLTERPIALLYNSFGTTVGMTHIMLPFLVLPLVANMRVIDRSFVLAAASLGASPRIAFWRVFFPMSLSGLLAGSSLVFVLSLGLYVTPALLGGGKVQVWAMRIDSDVSLYSNWGMASAAGVVLVITTFIFLFLFGRLVKTKTISN